MWFDSSTSKAERHSRWTKSIRSDSVDVLAGVMPSAEPVPEAGPENVVDLWPFLVRFGWFAIGFVAVVLLARLLVQPALERLLRRRNANNPTLQGAVVLYFRVGIVVVAALVGAWSAGYGRFFAGSALVVSAIALAIGVAAQEVIGSLVSGVALVLDPEFNVGDYIEWEDGGGVVQSIALRITRVRTRDGELVTVPNTVLTSQAITRPLDGDNYRVSLRIGLSYAEDLDEAITHIEEIAASVEGILEDPPATAYVDAFDDDAIRVHIDYWIDPERRDIPTVRSAYARTLKTRLEREGITISPPSGHALEGQIEIRTAQYT